MRRWCLLIVGFIGLSVGLAATPAPAVADSPVARGLCDVNLPFMSPADRLTVMNELGTQLHVKYLRLVFDWSAAEPQRGHFAKQYFDTFSSMVDEARAEGMQVILTVYTTPRWASNRSLWKNPPFGFKKNRYYSFYAMSTKCLPDFRGLAYHLAKRLKGRVFGYECWNEPNLWPFIYPQKLHSWDNFAAQLYRRCCLVLPGHPGRRPASQGHRWRDGAARLLRPLPHQPATLRRGPQVERSGALLRRLLPPSVHTRWFTQHRARCPSRTSHDDSEPAEPGGLAQHLPGQALLPDRIRLQHVLQRRLRSLDDQQDEAGRVPAEAPTRTPRATRRSRCSCGSCAKTGRPADRPMTPWASTPGCAASTVSASARGSPSPATRLSPSPAQRARPPAPR